MTRTIGIPAALIFAFAFFFAGRCHAVETVKVVKKERIVVRNDGQAAESVEHARATVLSVVAALGLLLVAACLLEMFAPSDPKKEATSTAFFDPNREIQS